MNDLEKKSIECIKNIPIEETTYQVARNVVLDYITNLQQENERLTNELNTCMIERNNFLSRIEKAVEILKDTNVDMPSTLLIETIDNGINILNGKGEE